MLRNADSGSSLRAASRAGLGLSAQRPFNPAALENLLGEAKPLQGHQRCLHHVGRIIGPERLGQYILDASRLKDRPNSSARNDAGARRCGTEENVGAIETHFDFMRQSVALKRNRHHGGTGAVATFANGIGHFTGLAKSYANAALTVSHHHQCAKTEAPAPFDDFGRSVNEYNFFR
jgi:hypothetical protein